MQVNRKRQQSLAFRWIIQAARSDKGKPMHLRLSKELMDASNGEGKAMSTRDQVHRMADANKAFAHFAW
jgi:small subunit ribosomal protein S7